MKAGRELDALVAEKVMWPTPESRERDNPIGFLPAFSTNIGAAWQIVDALMSGDWFSVALSCNHESGWCCRIDHGKIEADAETAPLAICRAALAAVGVPA